MLSRSALWAGVAVVAIGCAAVVIVPRFTGSKPLPPAAPAGAAAAKPAPPPVAATPTPPPIPDSDIATKPGDAFGVDMTLTAHPIVYVKGSGTWDNAFSIISTSLKRVEAYMEKNGIKADGLPMTIFTATDDQGFDFQIGLPIAELPKNPPRGDVAFGQSPAGHALEFVHRGSYEALEDTYEAITNYLDGKRLESKIAIEQYVTDPASTEDKDLVVNVIVLVN